MRPLVVMLVLLGNMGLVPLGAQDRANDSTRAITAHRDWWRAFTYGDSSALKRLSDPALQVVLSSGRAFDRTAAFADARTRGDSNAIGISWREERATVEGPSATVHSRFTERIGAQSSEYRFLTVLRRSSAGWRVLAAQSTLVPPERKPISVDREELLDFVGEYRGAAGEVKLAAADSGLLPAGLSSTPILLRPAAAARFFVPGTTIQVIFVRNREGRIRGFDALLPIGELTFHRKLP